jgi:hypothetical protein
LYGVDKNPFAVDLARLSLWLVTLAKDHPFTFLDHALRQGDSLVGLSREQIACVHWEVGKQVPTVRAVIEKAVREAEARRSEIHDRAMGDDVGEKRRLLDEAEGAVRDARMLGDCVVAAFFDEEKDGARKKRVKALADLVMAWASSGLEGHRSTLEGMARGLRERARPVTPFHWEVEFPEVFSRETGGFDAIVGNPPFMGGTAIGTQLGKLYHHYLMSVYEPLNPRVGNADLVAFFILQTNKIASCASASGFIATNSLCQGDTRDVGLAALRRGKVTIYQGSTSFKWPGEAAVHAIVVWFSKGMTHRRFVLDGVEVSVISSYLLPVDADDKPVVLETLRGRAFRGAEIRGSGFLFEDAPADGSSSIEDMKLLLRQSPSSSQIIRPYLGGEEFNSSPSIEPERFVIDFGERTEADASQWPLLMSIANERVKPIRDGNKQRNYRENWWLFATRVPEASDYMQEHGRLLAACQVSKYLAFAFVGGGAVLANTLNLVLLHTNAALSVLQSDLHDVWARFNASTLKDYLRYSPTDCFETFPFPIGVLEAARCDEAAQALPAVQRLEDIGKRYYEFRAALMVEHNEGLTATYNRFHDPEERDEGVLRLRELHAEMDRAVLDAYGWSDVQPRCEFLLDYEEEGDDEEESGKRRKKKPWRYRWPDEVRDEVLARLIALNGERAAEERRLGDELAKASAADKPKRAARKKTGAGGNDGQGGLFG